MRRCIGNKNSFGTSRMFLKNIAALVVCVFLFAPLIGYGEAQNPETVDSKRFITVDFDNVDIRLFIKYMSELTGKNFVVDKSVQGNVTIISPSKISEEEAYRVFESVLDVNGFSIVPSGSVIKIVPSAVARSKGIETFRSDKHLGGEDKVVTQLIPLAHTSPEEMKKILAPLVSKTSVMIGHTQSGMLIITETLSNIKRLMSIIKELDVEYDTEEVVVIPLKNSTSTTLAKILTTVYQGASGSGQKGGGKISRVKIVPYKRVNSLVVMASPDDIAKIKSLVKLMDTEEPSGGGNIHVFYLQHANSVELAKVLTSIPGTKTSGTDKGGVLPVSGNVKIMADEETNSLIITATKEEYAVLQEVIKKLDIPRQMVYLEALIMEVDANRSFELGVEWSGAGSFREETGELITGFSDSGYGALNAIKGDNKSLPASGFAFGVLRSGIQIGDVLFPNIGAILRAYKTDSDINIIATPQILTTDNKKAEISVGENVPFITSQNTTASEQDYTQYEYKDVATKLAITPQINQADTLRLEIETEVVKIKEVDNFRPTTYTRTAKTTVILNDKDTVVIGGIIGQDATKGENKIPLLGDIPLIGELFKSKTTTSAKTNMFIFVTPRIIRNPADITHVTLEKEDEISDVIPTVKEQMVRVQNKDHAKILTDKGQSYFERGQLVKAREYFEEALENDPEYIYAIYDMAAVSEMQGKDQVAIEYYKKVLDHDAAQDTFLRKLDNTSLQEFEPSLFEMSKEGIMRIQNKGLLE